jgi:hypothetical protein
MIGPTRRTVYFQFISINSLCMFRALICWSSGGTVRTAIGMFLCVLSRLEASCQPTWWAKKCSKHVEAINRNKVKVNSASSWCFYTDTLRCTVNKTLKFLTFLSLYLTLGYVNIYVCMYACTYVCVYVCASTYVCMPVCMYVRTHVCIYAHSRTLFMTKCAVVRPFPRKRFKSIKLRKS